MTKMKVAMYYNNDDIRIEEMPVPTITDDQLLVKIQSSGICGSDVMEWYRLKNAPRVLGHEIAGDIVKVGKNVKKYTVGDRVFVSHHVPCDSCSYCLDGQHTLCDTLHSTNFYPGGFAEYLRIPKINVEKGVFLLPKNISYDEGVFIEPLACVVRGLEIAEMKSGKTVLIIGSGITGLLQIKLVKVLGARRIIATDIDDYRLHIAQKIGADCTIQAKENVQKLVRKHNNGMLADLVIICVGVPSAIIQGLRSVNRGGTILFFAPTEPGIEVPFPLFDLWNKGVKMVSTYAGSPKDIRKAIDFINSKQVDVSDLITHRLPLSETAKGFKLVADAKKSIKVIIKPQN
jgi:L-iditol 2-dehydrogenase